MDAEDGALRGRLRITGEVNIRVPDGEATLASVEVQAEGGLRAPAGRVVLTLSGPLRELRKLGALSPGIATLLGHVQQEDDGRTGALTLVATPPLVDRLRVEGQSFEEEPVGEAFFENQGYVAAVFSLLDYAPEKVAVVTATWKA